MSRPIRAVALTLGLVLAACLENTAPGNDREARLDVPDPPARVVTVDEALSGAAVGLLQPETMSDADLGVLPQIEEPCRFRMTRIGFPVLAYGSMAVVKLNGALVPLPAIGDGAYAANGLEVSVRALNGNAAEGEIFPAEFVLRLPGAANELGFHGFSECGRA